MESAEVNKLKAKVKELFIYFFAFEDKLMSGMAVQY